MHRRAALTIGGSEAVRTGIAAAEDDDTPALGSDLIRYLVASHHLVLLGQEVHGEVNALELAAGNGEITRPGGTTGQGDGIELLAQAVGGIIDADVGARAEGDTLGRHLLHAPIDV